ncbi:MAG TPA: DNA translocase FtsK 4TM domain-containing protein, partial [Candidatus Eisenbacteria bacterium]
MWLLGRVSVRRKYQILGLCLLSLALFLVLALFSRDPRDTAADLVGTGAVRNQAGVLGAFAAAGLAAAFGAWGAWLIPVGLFAWGWNRLRIGLAAELWLRTALAAAAALTAMGLVFLLAGENQTNVGQVGEWVGRIASRLLGKVGAELLLGTALLIVGVIAFEIGSSSPLRKLLGSLLSHLGPARGKA